MIENTVRRLIRSYDDYEFEGNKFIINQINKDDLKFFVDKLELSIFNKNTFDLIAETRIHSVLEQFNLSDYVLIFFPYSIHKFKAWIEKNRKEIECRSGRSFNVNGTDTNHPHVSNGNDYTISPDGFTLLKIKEDVYYLKYKEERLESNVNYEFLLFKRKEIVTDFLWDFAHDLTECWVEAKKRIVIPSAFEKLFLDTTLFTDIKQDISNFLESNTLYREELKVPWKRGYMLIGPPGNGKSLLIRCISEYWGITMYDAKKIIARDGTVKFNMVTEHTLDTLICPDSKVPVIVVLEDIDKFTSFQAGNSNHCDSSSVSLHDLLKAIDGIDQESVDGLILIATTNYPEQLSDALINRPGRFDKIYKIDKPKTEEITNLLNYNNIVINEGESDLKEIAEKFENAYMNMAFVCEFVKSLKMTYKRNNFSRAEADGMLAKILEHDKISKKHFKEDKKIGFN